MKRYLLGYCIGYHLGNVQGNPEFLIEKKRLVEGPPGRWFNDPETVIFKTREEAEAKARQLMDGGDARWFTRGMAYHTDNPEHAKGLVLMEDATDTEKVWLS